MATKLPVIGTDWLDGWVDKYVIFSLKRSTPERFSYWKANNLGYTDCPFTAGIYDKSDIEREPEHYNDGLNCVAIPLTATALQLLGFPSGGLITNEVFGRFCNIETSDPDPEEE